MTNEYSLNINDDYKVIFYHIPKTAGTSIKSALNMDSGFVPYFLSKGAKNYNIKLKDYKKFSVVRNPYSRLISLYNYRKLRNYDNWAMGKDYDFNTWLKNPKLKGFRTIDDFYLFTDNFFKMMKDENTRKKYFNQTINDYIPYHLWLSNENNNLKMDFVLKQENLNNDFNHVFENCELPEKNTYNSNLREYGENNTLKVINDDYKSVYSRESLDIVNKIHKKDFELFKYEMI